VYWTNDDYRLLILQDKVHSIPLSLLLAKLTDKIEEYRELWAHSSAKQADGFIFVYSIDSLESFAALPQFLNIVRETKSTHLQDRPTSLNSPENNPFVFAVLGNKTDLPPERRQVPAQEGNNYTKAGGGLFLFVLLILRSICITDAGVVV